MGTEGEQKRVVVVEDDPDIRDLLAHMLELDGLAAYPAGTGLAGVELVREVDPDLVTLDLNLPDIDGTEVCRRIREFSDTYVLMITARADEIDRLLGLELGADDYMAKPFSTREVRARAGALLRRTRAIAQPPEPTMVYAGGGLVLVPVKHVAMLDGQPLPLTPGEVDLLGTLTSRPGQPWTRSDLVREVWKGDFIESDFLVDVHVGSLRRKLRKVTGHDWIVTVDGVGYLFDPLEPAPS